MKIILLVMCSLSILYIIYSLSKTSLKNFTSIKRSIFKSYYILKNSSLSEFTIHFLTITAYLMFNIIISILSIIVLKTAFIFILGTVFIILNIVHALNIYSLRRRELSKKLLKISTIFELTLLAYSSLYLITVVTSLLINK